MRLSGSSGPQGRARMAGQAGVVGAKPVVRSINDGVAAINGRVDRVIALVAGIKVDLDNVLVQVGGGGAAGHTGPGGKTISGHANSIDCSSAVSPPLSTASQGCER